MLGCALLKWVPSMAIVAYQAVLAACACFMRELAGTVGLLSLDQGLRWLSFCGARLVVNDFGRTGDAAEHQRPARI